MIFDAVSRDVCSAKRPMTGTPLQALVLLNDPQILEASRVLAYKTVEEKETAKERIAAMFRLATSREIKTDELDNLLSFFEGQRARFLEDEAAAKSLLSIGLYPQQELLSEPEIAAYTMVASAIFNLDETITRG